MDIYETCRLFPRYITHYLAPVEKPKHFEAFKEILEEWLSTITSFNVTVDEGNSSTDNTILLGIFERLGDQIELMERFLNKDQSTMAPSDHEFAILQDKFVRFAYKRPSFSIR